MTIHGATVMSTERLSITCEADVAALRGRTRDIAIQQALDAFAVAAITTAASELSRNVLVHGGGGFGEIEVVRDVGRVGLRLRFVDRGPGIADLDKAMHGGFTTGRSLGLGLSGSRRLVDEFHVETQVGCGTTVEVVKWVRFRT